MIAATISPHVINHAQFGISPLGGLHFSQSTNLSHTILPPFGVDFVNLIHLSVKKNSVNLAKTQTEFFC